MIKQLEDVTFILDLSFCDQRSFSLGEALMTPFIGLKSVYEEATNRFNFLVSSRFGSDIYTKALVDILLKFVDDEKDEKVALLFEGKYNFYTGLILMQFKVQYPRLHPLLRCRISGLLVYSIVVTPLL